MSTCEYQCSSPGIYTLTDSAGSEWSCCGRHLAVMVRLYGPGMVEAPDA